MDISVHIFSLVWMLFLWATTRYSVQMFQQNSYRTERYNRWLRSTGEWHMRSNVLSVAAALLFAFVDHWLLLLVVGVWMAVIAIAELSIRYKIPIAYTMRVRRLIATRLVITAVALTLVHIYAVEYTLVAMMLLSVDYWTVVAGAVISPVERTITRWYYNDAKRKLR